MAKTIMIADEIYNALTRRKHKKESYTELLARLLGLKKNHESLLECAGLWSDLSDDDFKLISGSLRISKKNWRKIKWQ